MSGFLAGLLQASLRISVVAGSVWLLLFCTRVRSSELRHRAWLLVLAAMLLMPVLPQFVWRVAPTVSVALPMEFAIPEPPLASSPSVTVPAAVVSAPVAPVARRVSWTKAALAIYLVVLLFLLMRMAAGWIAMRRLLRRALPAGEGVFESSLVTVPMTAGLVHPRVLLPDGWREWPREKQQAVLAHEFAHVARRDTIVSFVAHLNRCIFWFHPLAWWLERQLASVAEDACDDAGIRALGESHRYAEVLLDIAEVASRTGRRVSWQGVGVDGSGLLGARIDRILRGRGLFLKVTRTQRWGIAASCVAAVLLVATCRSSSLSEPLKVDPAEVARNAQNKEYQRLAKLSPAKIAEMEAAIAAKPDDAALRDQMVSAYLARNGREEAAPHQLWLAEHRPDIRNAWVGAARLPPASFPRMKAVWRALADRKDSPPAVLANAASFFQYEASDPESAEPILLRLIAQNPSGDSRRELGNLYGTVLTGGRPASPEFKAAVKKKLDVSSDAVVLSNAGVRLVFSGGRARGDGSLTQAGMALMQRSVALEPNTRQGQWSQHMMQEIQRSARVREAVGDGGPEQQYARVAALDAAGQLEFLPEVAEHAYIRGEMLDYYKHDATEGRRYMELGRTWAEQALKLCPGRESDPHYGRAFHKSNMLLGTVAMRVNGDKDAALKYLQAASTVYQGDPQDYFQQRLLTSLVHYGGAQERQAVIDYCERYGKFTPKDNQYGLLKSADQLRHGLMPGWYQFEVQRLK